MSRVLYLLGLAAFVCMNVAALSEFHGRFLVLAVSLSALLWITVLQRRRFREESDDHEYRRRYAASSDATYAALCGALGDLGYRVTWHDPASRTLRFRTSSPDIWIPSPWVDCRASVRQTDDATSEVVIEGRVDVAPPAEGSAPGGSPLRTVSTYPAGLTEATEKILDRVGATVVTYAMLQSEARGRLNAAAQTSRP